MEEDDTGSDKGKLGDMKAGLGGQGGAERGSEGSRWGRMQLSRARGTYSLLGTPASSGANPRLSVDERLLLITVYLFAWCHESTGDFIRVGKWSPGL